MASINLTRMGVASAIVAIGLGAGVVACSDRDRYDRCPDWQCGDGLFLAPIIVPAYGTLGQPGYVPGYTMQPNDPRYPKDRPSYVGKPPNFTAPSGAKVAPAGQKPPANYKAPSGSTLTVQKAPQKSGNTMPSSGGSSGGSKSSGGGQTVQKAPSGSSSGGGSKSSGGSSSGSSSSSGGKK